MIVGIGTDITTISRIAAILAQHPDRFEQRCFQTAEVELARRRGQQQAATLAGRWAAKEAFLKALGAANTGIGMSEIEVVHQRGGAPTMQLHGSAASALLAVGGNRVWVSIAHESEFAVALVIIE